MLSTYKRSPELYKRRYIDRDPAAQFISTPAMKLGSMVDDALTLGKHKYRVNPHDGRSKKGKAYKLKYGDYLLSQTDYDKAKELIKYIRRQSFFDKKSYDFQVLLEGKLNGTLFCGLADLIAKDKSCMIDLKVTGKVFTPHRWNAHAWDMGYYRQFAIYGYLFGHPVGCYWAVAHNAGYGVCSVKLYRADPELIAAALEEACELIELIKKKKFTTKKVTWGDVIDLGPPSLA